MKRLATILFCLVWVLHLGASSQDADAQSASSSKIRIGVNTPYVLEIPNTFAGSSYEIIAELPKGKDSGILGLELSGPPGLRTSVLAGSLRGGLTASLQDKKRWTRLRFGKKTEFITRANPGNSGGSGEEGGGSDGDEGSKDPPTGPSPEYCLEKAPVITVLRNNFKANGEKNFDDSEKAMCGALWEIGKDTLPKEPCASLRKDYGSLQKLFERVGMPTDLSEDDLCLVIVTSSYPPPALPDDGGLVGGGDEEDDGDSGLGETSDEYAENGPRVGGRALFRRNSCAPAQKYYARIVFNLKYVNRAALGDSFKIALRAGFKSYQGDKAASIKPVSDGKFGPSPLLLMSTIQFGESCSMTQWSGDGRIESVTPIRIEDYVFARGRTLTRSVISDIVKGNRKASFDLYTKDVAYSVCFKRTRVRQFVNGYPRG